MRFERPLIRGTLIKRYKRFMADVNLDDGTEVTAHCANSGSMLGCKDEGSEVWLSPADNPKRKLKYTWELVDVAGALVGINTARPNGLVEEAVNAGMIAELAGYESLRREVKYGKNSRIDLLLEGGGRPPCYVEVKNVTLARGGRAEFPDAVTGRGTKHLAEMSDMVAEGARAVMVYLVQREDCGVFGLASDIDPTYSESLARAMAAGVEAVCYACAMSTEEIRVKGPLPMELESG